MIWDGTANKDELIQKLELKSPEKTLCSLNSLEFNSSYNVVLFEENALKIDGSPSIAYYLYCNIEKYKK